MREAITKKALHLAENNKIVALELATGVGKSKIALDISSEYHNTNTTSVFKCLIVVAELAHIANWEKEAIQWGHHDFWNKYITVVTYASLKKHVALQYNIIILDEAHHIGSDIRLDILENIQFDKMLLLSATLGFPLKQALTALLKSPIETLSVTLQQAIDWDLLPTPKIILVPLRLDYKNKSETITEAWGKEELRVTYHCTLKERWPYLKQKKVKYPNVTLIMKCTPLEKYAYLTNNFNYYNRLFLNQRTDIMKNRWLQVGMKRKRFLGELKTPQIQLFLKTLKPTDRFICFCASIDQANLLGGANAIHSKKENVAQTIEDFNTNKIHNLFAVGMLQEGQNLANIELGIIVQLDGVERSFIQRFGRSLRAKDPVQYIFYYKNTRDEEYLNTILEGLNPNYIQTLNTYENNY